MCNKKALCRAIAAAYREKAEGAPKSVDSLPSPSPPAEKPKVVTLKFVISDSRLLSLPRELRDLIYYHTLVEPRRWDKRHSKDCVYHLPQAPANFPPYRTPEIDSSPCWITIRDMPLCEVHGEEDMCHRQRCKELCLRRRGLALLRTSKQIFDETNPTFWQNLTVCFDNAEILVATLQSLPDEIRDKIRKLSFLKPQKISGTEIDSNHGANPPFGSWLQRLDVDHAMRKLLNSMEGLIDLELPAEYFNILRNQCARFSNLRYLRCTTMEIIHYKTDHKRLDFTHIKGEILLDVALTRRFDPRGMGPHRCCSLGMYCPRCLEFFRRIALEGHHLDDSEVRDDVWWGEEVTEKLSRWQPTSNVHAPYTLPITLRNGVKCHVQVWGLPSNEWRVREKLLRADAGAEVGVVPRTHPAVQIDPDTVEYREKRLVSSDDLDSRRQQRYAGAYKNTEILTLRRRSGGKRRDVEQAAERREKYGSGGYDVAEEEHEES